MTDVPNTLADVDHMVAEARVAELSAWNAGNSRAAKRYATLCDDLLDLRPMVAMRDRIDSGVAPSLA